MKRISWLVIMTLVIAMVLPGLGPDGGLVMAADTLRVAKIIEAQGDVKVLRAGGEKPFPAYKGMGLTQGDTIVTGTDGQVTLEVSEDKEMKIGANTRLMLSELTQSLQDNADKTSFYLKAGQVYTNVKKNLAPGGKYEIRTPTAVMGVRGTQFFVSLSNGVAEVVTLEGLVTVTIPQQVTGADGTVTTEQMQIQVQPNQLFVQSGGTADPSQYNLGTLTSNQSLSLFVLETLQEVNQQQPGLINQQLLENLSAQIEAARQQQQQQLQQQQQQQQQGQVDEGGGSSDEPGLITIASQADLSLDYGEETTLEITVNPADASLSASVGNEEIAEVWLDGNTLIITAGERTGSTNITITASKRGYQEATRIFKVTVTEEQHLPEVEIDPIEMSSSLISGHNWECYITTNPSDAVISATVENSQIAALYVEPELRKIYLTGGLAGSTTVTVTAEKEGYLPASQTFTVTVVEQGQPTVLNDINTAPMNIIKGATGSRWFTVEPYDAVVDAQIADENIAELDLFESEGRAVFVTGKAAGSTTVTITAEKEGYLTVTRSFTVTVVEPEPKRTNPKLTYDNNRNRYLMVYEKDVPYQSHGIFGQLIDAAGEGGAEFAISEGTYYCNEPEVVYNSENSEFMVVWTDGRQERSQIYGQILNATDGSKVGSNFAVSADPLYGQGDPAIAYNSADDTYFVAWEESRPGNLQSELYGQVITTNGAQVGSKKLLITDDWAQYDPVLAYAAGSNKYLLAYVDSNDVKGRFIGVNGSPEGAILDIALDQNRTDEGQFKPDVVADNVNNRLLVVWQDSRGADWRSDIYGRFLLGSGATYEFGNEFIIQEESAEVSLTNPSVALNTANGRVLVAWEKNGDIFARPVEFGPDLGGLIEITTASADQKLPRLAYNSLADNYLIAYENYNEDPSYIDYHLVGSEADPESAPQFVSAKTISPFAFEIIFDQEVELVNPEYAIEQLAISDDSMSFGPYGDGVEIDPENPRRVIVCNGSEVTLSSSYTTDSLCIAAGMVRGADNDLPNEEIINKTIADGMGPRLFNIGGVVVTAPNRLELHFQEPIFLTGTELDFLNAISDDALESVLDLTGATAEISQNVVTITLASALADLNYGTNGLRIAAGSVKDGSNNNNQLIENQGVKNILPPYLVTNADYDTIDGLFPANGDIGINPMAPLILTFDRNAKPYFDENIEIRKFSDNTLVDEISLWDADWPNSGIFILEHIILDSYTKYYVVVPAEAFGIYGDNSVFFSGLDKNSWSFTTGANN